MRHVLATLGFFILLVIIWDLFTRFADVSPVMFPSPPERRTVLLWQSIQDGSLFSTTSSSP